MKVHVWMLVTVTAMAFCCVQNVCGLTMQWERPLGYGTVVQDIVADGSGGAVVCYYNTASNAAYVTYFDKDGATVWHKMYSNSSVSRCKYVTKKQAIVTVAPAGAHYALREIDMKTGDDSLVVSTSGASYTTEQNVVAPNKDTKGFYCIMSVPSGGATTLMRYTYK